MVAAGAKHEKMHKAVVSWLQPQANRALLDRVSVLECLCVSCITCIALDRIAVNCFRTHELTEPCLRHLLVHLKNLRELAALPLINIGRSRVWQPTSRNGRPVPADYDRHADTTAYPEGGCLDRFSEKCPASGSSAAPHAAGREASLDSCAGLDQGKK